jgi:hypothetical protein
MHCRPDNQLPVDRAAIEEAVEEAVEEAGAALSTLNAAVLGRTGARALLPRPALIPDVVELMKDPPLPEFPFEDDEIALLKEVRNKYQ